MATRYVSNLGSDATDGLSEGTAWATIAKVNLSSVGQDTVLFRKGDTFTGQLVPKSGVSGTPTVYGTYGTGANPSFSGFETLTAWELHSGSIWKSAVTASDLNMVLVDGVNTAKKVNPMWSTYEIHLSKTSITDNELSASPSLIGNQVVIRTSRWKMEVATITGHSGTTISFDAITDEPTDGYGYFIQNSLNHLTTDGDWCVTGGFIYMNFGVATPAVRTIKAAASSILVSSISKSYWQIDGITIEGSNDKGVKIYNPIGISIENSTIKYCGINGIESDGSPSGVSLMIENNLLEEINGSAVYSYSASTTVQHNTVSKIGLKAGMGDDAWGNYCGMSINGADSIVQQNNVTDSGYDGIQFRGNNTLVRNNKIDGFCSVLDDGGGIYTSSSTYSGRLIDGNIVLNGKDAFGGLPANMQYNAAFGIYLDEGADDVPVKNNTVFNTTGNMRGGIIVHVSDNTDIDNNLVYNCERQLYISNNQATIGIMTDVNITNNILVARTATQTCFNFISNYDDLNFGSSNGNVFARPIDDTDTISVDTYNSSATLYDLAGWKILSGYDANSTKSPKSITDVADLSIEINDTTEVIVVSLASAKMDMLGNVYSSSITLQPFTSKVLLNHTIPASKFLTNPNTGRLLVNTNTGKYLTVPA